MSSSVSLCALCCVLASFLLSLSCARFCARAFFLSILSSVKMSSNFLLILSVGVLEIQVLIKDISETIETIQGLVTQRSYLYKYARKLVRIDELLFGWSIICFYFCLTTIPFLNSCFIIFFSFMKLDGK